MKQEHKERLAQGRRDAAVVRRYLEYLDVYRPKRGRPRSEETVQGRLAVIESSIDDASVLRRLNMIQERMDLEVELERMRAQPDGDELRAGFIEVASRYAESKGLTRQAFRQMGVDAATLREAGL